MATKVERAAKLSRDRSVASLRIRENRSSASQKKSRRSSPAAHKA